MNNTYLNGIDFNVGIYIRLSQEDKDKKYESDSESVINQKELLRNYVKSNNFNLVKEYVDDGFSGTDFERPGFQRMLEDINNKKINCVIVKDLSRLGRDHVMTGYYIETFFPENNIRFISILESFDSFKNQASNDSSTFIIACNDYYSKQNSIKIRNVLNEKRKNGKFVGSLPCYGYMRDPEDKGHLIPNPETAPIVKKIFKWRADGIGPTEIANRLNKAHVVTPSGYKKTNYSSRLIDRDNWNISTVKKILINRVYTGDLVQHTQTKVSYKSKKKIAVDEKFWIVVNNTHEALVDKDTFEYVNNLRIMDWNTRMDLTAVTDEEDMLDRAFGKETRPRELTEDEDNHFTKKDVRDALEAYKDEFCTMPINSIVHFSGIPIEKNKRNGRSQAVHIKLMNKMRDLKIELGETPKDWAGRPSYREAVFKFLDMNPEATAVEFCELTNMSRAVFFKYKKEWQLKQDEEYHAYRNRFAIASIFDNCVKDAETGESVNLAELITGVPVPKEPVSFEEFKKMREEK